MPCAFTSSSHLENLRAVSSPPDRGRYQLCGPRRSEAGAAKAREAARGCQVQCFPSCLALPLGGPADPSLLKAVSQISDAEPGPQGGAGEGRVLTRPTGGRSRHDPGGRVLHPAGAASLHEGWWPEHAACTVQLCARSQAEGRRPCRASTTETRPAQENGEQSKNTYLNLP